MTEKVKLRAYFDVQTGKLDPRLPITRVDGKPYGIYQLFHQGQWWQSRDETWHLVAELDFGHAENLLRFLDRCAGVYKERIIWATIAGCPFSGEHALDAFDEMIEDLDRQDKHEWLHSTELYQAIAARAALAPPRHPDH